MMSFDFGYSTILPLPVHRAEVTDHADSAANYGFTGPNVGHSGNFNFQRDYAWASTQRLFSFISFLML